MPKRSVNWKEDLSKKLLSSRKNRREYFLALIEEGFSWREALEHIIKVVGVKEYSALSKFKAPNLLSQLKPQKDIRLSTLEKMVSPLGVELTFLTKKAS